MQTVGIKVLKNRLSEYVRVAASGQAVLVTDRGRVVAELIAPRAVGDTSSAERRLAELVAAGLITPAPILPLPPLPPRRPITTLEDVLADLDASRADR